MTIMSSCIRDIILTIFVLNKSCIEQSVFVIIIKIIIKINVFVKQEVCKGVTKKHVECIESYTYIKLNLFCFNKTNKRKEKAKQNKQSMSYFTILKKDRFTNAMRQNIKTGMDGNRS